MMTSPDNWLRRKALFAMFLALGIVLYVLEGLFPPLLPVPGAKLGLSSIIVIIAMLVLGYTDGIWLAMMRSILGSFIGGAFLSPGSILSLVGALVSAMVVAFALKFLRPALSLIGISILGAIAHNLTQLLLAFLLLIKSAALLYYLPFLLLFGLVSGSVTGLLAVYLVEQLPLTKAAWPQHNMW